MGLCLERSAELIVGILGILKAGGAYLPLDPSYPSERLRFILADSSCNIVLTLNQFRDQLPTRHICLDSDWPTIAECSIDGIETGLHADNLVYVIYTSGSTGRPKGVAVTHGGLLNYVWWCTEAYKVDELFGAVLHSSVGADLSVTALWSPLCVGRTVTIIEAAPLVDLTQSLAQCTDFGLLKLTPTHLTSIDPEKLQSATNSLGPLVVGGEALTSAQLTAWRNRFSSVRIINEYGPTETVVGCCCYELPAGALPTGSIPIGRPIANTQVYVLDGDGDPVPIGVPGELYIGGAGLARGYLNRPELTAERFVANPFSDDPAARLYRTGDRCRWRSDGNLEFLGRLDDQVKLRGYRIELGEIESVLNDHPAVAHSVVMLREDRPGDQRLVAYCVAAAGDLNIAALRSHLASRLPSYMVPAALVVLDALPLTRSGKVDRRSLPAPDDCRPDLAAGYVAARNPIEEQLAALWCEVLALEAVGVHDNFFALGGHSLLAMRLHVRITSLWQLDLPLRRLFEAPTIAELAPEIEALRGGGVLTSGTALQRMDRDQLDHLPLSFAQQRLWFLEQLEGELTAYNMPYAWRLRGPLDTEALRRALEAVVRRHEPLRTTFAMIAGQPVQRIGTIDRFELPLQDLSSLPPQQREAEIVERCRLEAERPFDLSRRPDAAQRCCGWPTTSMCCC